MVSGGVVTASATFVAFGSGAVSGGDATSGAGAVTVGAGSVTAGALVSCQAVIPPPATSTMPTIAKSAAFDLGAGTEAGAVAGFAFEAPGCEAAMTVRSSAGADFGGCVLPRPGFEAALSPPTARSFLASDAFMTTVATLGRTTDFALKFGSFIAFTNSRTLAKRSSPFLESARATATETCSGISGTSSMSEGASNMQCLCRMSIAESPSNGTWPASMR